MGEPNPTNRPSQTSEPLDYATRVGEYPRPTAHPRLVLPILLLTALAGIWSIIIGVTSLGDIWLFGVLQIAAGICLCWGTIGKLSAANVRPKSALALLLPAILILAGAGLFAHRL